jgi:hypothetical protein
MLNTADRTAAHRKSERSRDAMIFARADFVDVRWHRMEALTVIFGVDVEEGFTLGSLIMTNRGLFSWGSGSRPALGFWLLSVAHASQTPAL